jgi:hypothetical protein
MLARLHMQEMHRQADQARLAQLAEGDRAVEVPYLSLMAQRIWHALNMRIRTNRVERNTGTAQDQALSTLYVDNVTATS